MMGDWSRAGRSEKSDAFASVVRRDTANPRGSFARLVRRKTLQTNRFAAILLLPAEQKPSRRDAILIEFGA